MNKLAENPCAVIWKGLFGRHRNTNHDYMAGCKRIKLFRLNTIIGFGYFSKQSSPRYLDLYMSLTH
jgi:hypothetical protein